MMDDRFDADPALVQAPGLASRPGPSGFDQGERFTPGPWGIETFQTGHHYIGVMRKSGTLGTIICDLESGEGYTPEATERATANAHLIAAAPELYERLTNARDQIVHLQHFPENVTSDATWGLLDLIGDALAKARAPQADTRRMVETGTGSMRSTGSGGPLADAPNSLGDVS
jgi:hypothetical protein